MPMFGILVALWRWLEVREPIGSHHWLPVEPCAVGCKDYYSSSELTRSTVCVYVCVCVNKHAHVSPSTMKVRRNWWLSWTGVRDRWSQTRVLCKSSKHSILEWPLATCPRVLNRVFRVLVFMFVLAHIGLAHRAGTRRVDTCRTSTYRALTHRAGILTQQVKALVIKPDNLSLISRTHMMEGEN